MSDSEKVDDKIEEVISSIPKELEPKLREMAIAETKPPVEMKIEETEELTGELESKKPKVKRERTEKQKAVFEKARLKRQENIAKRKAEKEATKKPRGRPPKEPEPEPPLEPSSEDETIIEEEIEYRKKPKAKPKATKKVKKVVYISDDSDEDSSDEEFYNQLQKKYSKPVQQAYQPEPQVYQTPTSMNNFYRFA